MIESFCKGMSVGALVASTIALSFSSLSHRPARFFPSLPPAWRTYIAKTKMENFR